MIWGEWLNRFRAASRASLVLDTAANELNMLGCDVTLPAELRDEIQRSAIAIIKARESLRTTGQRVLGDRRYLEQQMKLPEVG